MLLHEAKLRRVIIVGWVEPINARKRVYGETHHLASRTSDGFRQNAIEDRVLALPILQFSAPNIRLHRFLSIINFAFRALSTQAPYSTRRTGTPAGIETTSMAPGTTKRRIGGKAAGGVRRTDVNGSSIDFPPTQS